MAIKNAWRSYTNWNNENIWPVLYFFICVCVCVCNSCLLCSVCSLHLYLLSACSVISSASASSTETHTYTFRNTCWNENFDADLVPLSFPWNPSCRLFLTFSIESWCSVEILCCHALLSCCCFVCGVLKSVFISGGMLIFIHEFKLINRNKF